MKTLLFYCGFASGGTDLTKNILNAHPDIKLFSELPNLASISAWGYNSNTLFCSLSEVLEFRRLLNKLHPGDDFEKLDYDLSKNLLEIDLAQKNKLRLGDVLRRCLSTSEALVWGAKISLGQIRNIRSIFPEAKFLFVTRDVRDICLSWHNKWGKDMIWCSDKWSERMQKDLKVYSQLTSETYFSVKFECLLSDTEATCRDFCDFLNITHSENMQKYHLYTDHWQGKLNYGKPIIPGNKEKWRNELPKKKVSRIEEIAFDTMKLLNYNPELASKPKPITRYEKIRGICRDSWAILFIGNRSLKQKNTFHRRLKTAINVLRGLVFRRKQGRRA